MSLQEKLRANIVIDERGCWIWQGCRTVKGYGRVWNGNKTDWAHRVSYSAFKGDCFGRVVRHSCDNPPCINPAHLSLGTQADNIADATRRKRIAVGNRLPQAKLTTPDVLAIRADNRSQSAIATEYGVTQSIISDIKLRKSWRHV